MALRRRHLGLALALPALAVPAVVSPAAAVQAPPTRSLPSGLDAYVPYQGQTVCDPRPRPGVLAFARLMTSHYGMGSTALIGRTCGSDVSEHYDGRAWDWMLNVDNPSQEAVAQSVLAWLTGPDKNGVQGAMARRFGIMYIIHNRKMWRSYATERGWAPYYGSSPHTDHVHFSFNFDGAAGRTSWWTGVPTRTYLTSLPPAATSTQPTTPPAPSTTPATPVSTPPAVLSYGMRSEGVRQLQSRLGNLPTTGYFGDQTRARVTAYQSFVGLPRTGVADLRTQEILATRGWRSVAAAYPTLRYGTTSNAVRTLQARLGSLPTTGFYGTLTQARVTAYQRFAGLPQTGIADSRTQQTLYTRGWAARAATASPAALVGTPGSPSTPAVITADLRTTSSGKDLDMTTYASTSSRTSPGVARVDVATSYTPYKSLTIAAGSRGAAVRALQRALGGLAVDGVFGAVTRDKVVLLQRSLALPQTGVVTSELWDVLEARDFPFVADRSTVLRAGDTGPQVLAVQRLLGVRQTGVFDLATREAVKAAQARAGLASTGVVASRTWSLFDRLSA
jgi:peptidoglycan hydrolase-like protein with peptidoglycan-binding domain